MADRLLDIANLSVAFDGKPVVEGLSFHLHAGETLALVGESGSGKSVTALGMMNLLADNASVSGTRRLDGQNLATLDRAGWNSVRGGQVGFVFQEPMTSLNPLHRVSTQIGEALLLHQGLSGQAADQRILELLEQVRLPNPESLLNRWPHQLSGGQRQRVMIAIAIANRPRLLIADEPTTALDVTVQQELLGLLRDLRDQHGMGMLFITHDLNLVRAHANRVCVLQAGKCREQGPVDTVFNAARDAYTRALLAAEPSGQPAPIKTTSAHLNVTGLSVSFKQRRSRLFERQPAPFIAVEATDLQIARGETLGIVGESGSGKTSLAQAIMRLIPAKGQTQLGKDRLDALDGGALRRQRKRFQMVFQDPYGALSPRMSVFDIVSEGLRLHAPELDGDEVDKRVSQTLLEVGLPEDIRHRYPHEFSGGQRQRIAIARAIILEPELLVLDEPTSALDRTVQRQIIDLLRETQRKRGISYLFISHDLAVVRAVAHRVLVMKEGQVIESGSCQQVLTTPAHPYTQRLLQAAGITA